MHRRDGCLEGILKLVLLTAVFDCWRTTLALAGVAPVLVSAVDFSFSSSLSLWPAGLSPAPTGSACFDHHLWDALNLHTFFPFRA